MPRIAEFYGIAIYMYWNERDRPIPHFHASHAEYRASVSLDGVVLAGSLESRSLALVLEWAQLHREELMANWNLARDNRPLLPITPAAVAW
jgi:hypothetical protein